MFEPEAEFWSELALKWATTKKHACPKYTYWMKRDCIDLVGGEGTDFLEIQYGTEPCLLSDEHTNVG